MFDEGHEYRCIRGPVKYAGRDDALGAQGRNGAKNLPVPIGGLSHHPLPDRGPPIATTPIAGSTECIEEYQLV
jgi:hypothetical protein